MKQNVLLFCVDEMRADHMACAGNPLVSTPNLDRLAAQGTLFSNACCNNPICMPARASMFTGLLPRDHGVRINGHNLRRDLPVLPQIFMDAGYRTHAAGKLHLTSYRPMTKPDAPDEYPECIDYWNSGLLKKFPTPYYGFETVDFVGGHTSFVFGDYIEWLKAAGGNPEMLKPEMALNRPAEGDIYKMALPENLHYNRYIADSTIRLIHESAANNQRPFFAWCSIPDPHAPVAPPAPYCNMYNPSDIPLPPRREGEPSDLPPVYRDVYSGRCKPNGTDNRGLDEGKVRTMTALTYGMITHLDAEIGRVLDALEDSGQAGRTVIGFVADHGDMMGDHGLLWKAFYTFQGCTRIPMILSVPGMPGGKRCDALASQIDLMPTLLDLCGIQGPQEEWRLKSTPFERGSIRKLRDHPGHSLRPLIEGTADSVRDEIVIENDDPTTGFQIRALITSSHRLAIYPGTTDGELFDLNNDPEELHNLWYKEEHRDLRARLTAQLLDSYSRDTPFTPVPPWNS